MRSSRLIAVAATIAVFFVLLSPGLLAQTTGDFRSFQNGNWNDVNSWERYNGTIWVNPAPSTPMTTDGIVTILSGDTITVTAIDSVDEFVVDGALVLNDTLIIADGTGSDAVVNGSVIMANAAGRMALSVVGTADISFATGSFYRHTVNGGAIPTATWGTGSTCEITGATANSPGNANQNFYNFTWNCVSQSSNLNVAWNNNTIGGDLSVMASGTSSRFQMTSSTYSGTTITINGNILLSGGALASNGSGGAATYAIVVNGNLNVTGGNLGVSRGSGGNATWWLKGDMSVSNATIQTSNSSSRFIFAKYDTQTVTFVGVTNTGSFQYEIDTSTTVILANGADAVDWTVPDSLINRGNLVTNGAMSFANGSVYVHEQNGGSVPIATWATGSECRITGVTSTKPSNLNQDYYNFVWDCPGQSSNLDWSWYNNTVSGNVSVLNSGSSSRARITSNGASPLGANTITIMGTVTVVGAAFESTGSGAVDTIIVESHGNVSVTGGGTLAVSRSSLSDVIWNLYGNLTVDNSTTRCSRDTLAYFQFKGTTDQHLTLINATITDRLPIAVAGGATLELDSSVVTGSGDFTVMADASVATSLPGGFNDNLLMTGEITLDQGANYIYNGSVAQSTGSLLPGTIRAMIADNAAGLTMGAPVTLTDSLFLFSGVVSLGNNDLTAAGIGGGSSTAYVSTDGTGKLSVSSVGSTTASFPVGTSSYYAPVWITNAGTADAFSVSARPDTGYATSRVLVRWDIAEGAAGGSDCTLGFGWMGAVETAGFTSTRATASLIFELAGKTEVGTGAYTRQTATEPYTVSRGGFSTFGAFAVGDFVGTATSVEETEAIPQVFSISQNYPNPFNPSTTIKYDIPVKSQVSIKIYDAIGRVVANLVDEEMNPGFHSVKWNADRYTSGVYFVRIIAGDFHAVRKLMLVK